VGQQNNNSSLTCSRAFQGRQEIGRNGPRKYRKPLGKLMNKTTIEYLTHTWNPVTGCTPVSAGCAHCWARAMHGRKLWGDQPFDKVVIHEERLRQPLDAKKGCRIGVCFMGDAFHPDVSYEFIDDIMAVSALCPQHLFFFLTKRPERMLDYFGPSTELADGTRDAIVEGRAQCIPRRTHEDPSIWLAVHWPIKNIWLGTSIENQKASDERREYMLKLAGMGFKTWVSYEPAIGPVNWDGWEFIRFMASAGESGHGARPSHPDWHKAAWGFCQKIGANFCFKGWGEWGACGYGDPKNCEYDCDHKNCRRISATGLDVTCDIRQWKAGDICMKRVGKKASGRMLDGCEWLEFPER
jgi:protein gp37